MKSDHLYTSCGLWSTTSEMFVSSLFPAASLANRTPSPTLVICQGEGGEGSALPPVDLGHQDDCPPLGKKIDLCLLSLPDCLFTRATLRSPCTACCSWQ